MGVNPTVSLLMPTYEPNPVHLREALECVLNQSYPDWTLMIRDDASKADVHAMVVPFLADPRITFVRNAQRKGIGRNWNACLKDVMVSSDKPYIQFFFQDDLWSPDYLEKSIQALESTGADISSAAHAYHIEGEEMFKAQVESTYAAVTTARKAVTGGKHDAREFLQMWIRQGLRPNIVGEPCFVMLRKSLVDRVGPFAEDLTQILDTEYWIRCLQKTVSIVILQESLGQFRVHAKGTSAQNNARAKRRTERWKFLQRHPILAVRAGLRR